MFWNTYRSGLSAEPSVVGTDFALEAIALDRFIGIGRIHLVVGEELEQYGHLEKIELKSQLGSVLTDVQMDVLCVLMLLKRVG